MNAMNTGSLLPVVTTAALTALAWLCAVGPSRAAEAFSVLRLSVARGAAEQPTRPHKIMLTASPFVGEPNPLFKEPCEWPGLLGMIDGYKSCGRVDSAHIDGPIRRLLGFGGSGEDKQRALSYDEALDQLVKFWGALEKRYPGSRVGDLVTLPHWDYTAERIVYEQCLSHAAKGPSPELDARETKTFMENSVLCVQSLAGDGITPDVFLIQPWYGVPRVRLPETQTNTTTFVAARIASELHRVYGKNRIASPRAAAEPAQERARPNILWIVCEDISPYLGCYGFEQAHTPNLDRLASDGVRFTRAYANGAVCAVARSTLLTGMYATAIGTHPMRCRTQLPATIPAYPKLLKAAGYYCTNNSKKDYNSSFENDNTLWDESSGKAHWKNRQPGQPFFAVFNIGTTHESQLAVARIQRNYVQKGLIPATPRIPQADIKLPPYHPDLSDIREDWSRLHDLITLMDAQAGERLRELEEAGLAEETIVFFYSDHGGMLSRAKRYIYNGGTQVPFIVRFPDRWRHLAPTTPGGTVDRLVSFVDFPKTVLSLAGAETPTLMQGRIFLGPGSEPAPAVVYFSRDRMAERPDFSRAATDGRYTFIRNFMPHRPPGRDSRYGNDTQANWNAWERHFDQGKCDPIQSQFYQPKPLIELFDTQADPWHVTNLAGRPEHAERMRALEAALDRWMIETRDIGLVPEPLFHELAGPNQSAQTLYEYVQQEGYPAERLLAVAKAASAGEPLRLSEYLAYLRDDNPVVRNWGAYGLFLVKTRDGQAAQALKHMAEKDAFAGNRVTAAQALGVCGEPEAAFRALLAEARAARHGAVLLQSLNALQYSHTDDRLTQEDWQAFGKMKPAGASGEDKTCYEYARRIATDALALWPERRRVD
jgi:arylsulfatase A-like enzyme